MVSLKQALKIAPTPIGKVTLCEGEEWEIEVEIPRPAGRKWISRYPKLASFVIAFSREMFPDMPAEVGELKIDRLKVDPKHMVDIMDKYFDRQEFMADYVPAVFGLESEDGQAYIERFLEPTNIIAPFFEAAMMIMGSHEGNPSVEEAKKKSKADNGSQDQDSE